MTGSIVKLATSRGIVIAIGLVTAPVLGRLFLPHAYGALGVLSTVLSIIAAFASLSYVFAIPLAVSTLECRNLFVLCSVIGIFTTGIVAAGSLLGGGLLAALFHEPDVAKYALFLPFMFLAGNFRQLLDTTLSCQGRFSAVAVRNVLEACVTRVSQLGLYLCGLGGSPVALILGSLAGSLVAAFTSGAASIRGVFRTVQEPLRLTDLLAVAAKHRSFPLIQSWSATLNAVTVGLPTVVLGWRFSLESVGLYGMANTMINLPLVLFTSSTAQVFYVEAGKCFTEGRSTAPRTEELVRMLSLLTAFPLVVVLVLGPLLFDVFLGTRWHEAGVIAQILFPWMAIVSFASPLSAMFLVVGRQGEALTYNIVLLAVRFSALYFGGMYFGVRATLAIFVAASVIVWIVLTTRAVFLSDVSRRWVARVIIQTYAEALLLLAPAGILYWWLRTKPFSLAALAAACVVHSLILFRRHPEILKPLLRRLLGTQAAFPQKVERRLTLPFTIIGNVWSWLPKGRLGDPRRHRGPPE